MPDKPLKVAIIGKRNIQPGEWNTVYDQVKLKIAEILRRNKIDTHSFVGYSAMASGADTIFAEVVKNEFRQPLKIILPFAADEYRKDFSDTGDRQAFDEWIHHNGVEKIIHDGPIQNAESRNDAYYETGKYFIDNCDEVIFVWDGLRPAGKGGTADMLGLLSQHKNPHRDVHIIRIHPFTPDELHDEIRHQQLEADAAAVALKRKYSFAWKSSVLLGCLAAVCFAINAAFEFEDHWWNNILSLAEFGFAFIIVIIVRIYTGQDHRQFIKQRIKAEKLRLIEVFYLANAPIEQDRLTNDNDPELSALIRKINTEISKAGYTSHFSFYCVRNLVEGQINYHQFVLKLKGRSINWPRICRELRGIAIVLFLANLLVSLANALLDMTRHISFYPHHISVFAGIVLSTSFATIESILFFTEWRHSGAMLAYFKSAHYELKNEPERANDILKEVSTKMLSDIRGWEAVVKKRQVTFKPPG